MNNQIKLRQNGNSARSQKNPKTAKQAASSRRARPRGRVQQKLIVVPRQNRPQQESAPLALSRQMRTMVPSVSGSPYSGDGRVVVRHREYVGEVLGSVAFAVTSYSINPGLSSLFTWLAPMAGQFESYLFDKCDFLFETEKSASTSGAVMLAIDFDASDAAPANKQQMMAAHNAVRSAVWQESRYRADRADLRKFGTQRYIRSGALAANQDIKTFDVGNLFVATQGCADATAIGELYIEYEIHLITPQADPAALFGANSALVTAGGTISKSAQFGTAAVVTGGLPISASGNTLTFNKVGQYLVDNVPYGTVFTDVAPTVTGTATSTLAIGALQNAAATSAVHSRLVSINEAGLTLIIDWSAVSTTVTAGVTRVALYQYSLG